MMRERAIHFGVEADLVGILCEPTRATGTSIPAFVLNNAGLLHRVGPHRVNVLLARRLAQLGVPSLRFDLSNVGDSGPRRDRIPFVESLVSETREAMDAAAAELGVDRFVVGGLCSGADQAWRTGQVDERMVGGVLLDPFPYLTPRFHLQRYLRLALRTATWTRLVRGEYGIRERVIDWIERDDDAPVEEDLAIEVRDIPPQDDAEAGYHRMLDRGVNLYVLYTAGQLSTYNYPDQFCDMHPTVPIGGRLQLDWMAHADHTFTQRAVQRDLVDRIVRWARDADWTSP